MTTLSKIYRAIEKEMDHGISKYGQYHNAHEHYAVLQEEVDEWWDAVKSNSTEKSHFELIQIAAIAIRYFLEHADEKDLEKPWK